MHADPLTGQPGTDEYQLQIPQLPILGPPDFMRLLMKIFESIVGEATAAEFYARLLQDAPDELHREFIGHALKDEMEHQQAFSALYTYFTNQIPVFIIEPVQYTTYKEGILIALRDELEAAGFYRDIQLSTTDRLVRDTFYLAMVDELEHATRFGVLYNTI